MDQFQPAQADQAVELRERVVEGGLRMERVAGGEHVAGVEAHADPLPPGGLGVDAVEDRGDLRERRAQARPLAGRGLDEDAGREPARAVERRGDAVGRAGEGAIERLLARRARMGDDPADAELLGPLQLRHQAGDRFVAERLVGGGGIDEIGIVGHDAGQARVADGRAEGGGRGGIDRRHAPLVDIAGEDLQALAARLHGPLDGLGESAGDRLVGAHRRSARLTARLSHAVLREKQAAV